MSEQLSAVLSDAHLEKKETELRKYGVTEVDDLKELDDNATKHWASTGVRRRD